MTSPGDLIPSQKQTLLNSPIFWVIRDTMLQSEKAIPTNTVTSLVEIPRFGTRSLHCVTFPRLGREVSQAHHRS
jgi:hypothetical protein